MAIKRFNKATASAVGGAVVAALGMFVDLAPEVLAAIQVIITTALVYFVPNLSKGGNTL